MERKLQLMPLCYITSTDEYPAVVELANLNSVSRGNFDPVINVIEAVIFGVVGLFLYKIPMYTLMTKIEYCSSYIKVSKCAQDTNVDLGGSDARVVPHQVLELPRPSELLDNKERDDSFLTIRYMLSSGLLVWTSLGLDVIAAQSLGKGFQFNEDSSCFFILNSDVFSLVRPVVVFG
ncbi:hypothetical protein Tco_1180720 [Tanacetum coccineum]